MAAIPPLHEDPPVGTNNMVQPPAEGQPQVAQQDGADTAAATPGQRPVHQGPPLPADWSPATPPAQDDTGPASPA